LAVFSIQPFLMTPSGRLKSSKKRGPAAPLPPVAVPPPAPAEVVVVEAELQRGQT